MPLPDYYAILEVPATATFEQVKRAYRRLARENHPDLHREKLDTHIKQLNEAYAVLSDPVRRAAYDASLLEEFRRAEAQRSQRVALQREKQEPKMTWAEGLGAFIYEIKKGMRDEK
jgi:curved DNA-binding protein CbpA